MQQRTQLAATTEQTRQTCLEFHFEPAFKLIYSSLKSRMSNEKQTIMCGKLNKINSTSLSTLQLPRFPCFCASMPRHHVAPSRWRVLVLCRRNGHCKPGIRVIITLAKAQPSAIDPRAPQPCTPLPASEVSSSPRLPPREQHCCCF